MNFGGVDKVTALSLGGAPGGNYYHLMSLYNRDGLGRVTKIESWKFTGLFGGVA